MPGARLEAARSPAADMYSAATGEWAIRRSGDRNRRVGLRGLEGDSSYDGRSQCPGLRVNGESATFVRSHVDTRPWKSSRRNWWTRERAAEKAVIDGAGATFFFFFLPSISERATLRFDAIHLSPCWRGPCGIRFLWLHNDIRLGVSISCGAITRHMRTRGLISWRAGQLICKSRS